jgi:hypothetical protein
VSRGRKTASGHTAKHEKPQFSRIEAPLEEILGEKRPHAFLAEKAKGLFRGSLRW